jgi:hypothetical protein
VVEAFTMGIKQCLVVTRFDLDAKAELQMAIEVHQMRIDIIQEGDFGRQPQSHRQASAERLNIASFVVLLP